MSAVARVHDTGNRGVQPVGEAKPSPPPLIRPRPRPRVGRREFWRCACGRTLGERIDDRLFIKTGDRAITVWLPANVSQPCPRCGAVSAYVYAEFA